MNIDRILAKKREELEADISADLRRGAVQYIRDGGTKAGLGRLLRTKDYGTYSALWDSAMDKMNSMPVLDSVTFNYELVEDGVNKVYWNRAIEKYEYATIPAEGKHLIYSSADPKFLEGVTMERKFGLSEWPPADEVKP